MSPRVSPPPPPTELHTTSAAVPQRAPRESSSRSDERDGPWDHWVTIDGTHVLIHEPQGRQAAQERPLASIIVLGKEVSITYETGIPSDDKLKASKAIAAAADVLNKNADKLRADEKKSVAQISSFSVTESPNAYLGASGKGRMTISFKYIHDTSAAWLGSLFGHEGQHYLNAGKYSGADRWRDEQSAGWTQLAIGEKIGFTAAETDFLREYIDDKNRAKMQEHMEKGYSY